MDEYGVVVLGVVDFWDCGFEGVGYYGVLYVVFGVVGYYYFDWVDVYLRCVSCEECGNGWIVFVYFVLVECFRKVGVFWLLGFLGLFSMCLEVLV